MRSAKNKFIALLTLLLLSYNVLLINGGRGPFTLYESYWACHCDDNKEVSVNDGDLLTPQIITGSARQAGPSLNDDICVAPRTTNGNELCKTKLPLRYINLLLSGTFMIELASSITIEGLYFPFSKIQSEVDVTPVKGITHDLLRPPKFPIA